MNSYMHDDIQNAKKQCKISLQHSNMHIVNEDQCRILKKLDDAIALFSRPKTKPLEECGLYLEVEKKR